MRGPLKGQSMGEPSNRNIENRLASPEIVEQIVRNGLRSGMQNAVIVKNNELN